MGFIGSAYRAAKFGASASLGNTAGRIATGAVAGAGYNWATSDYWSTNNTVGSVLKGAVIGAGLGAGISGIMKFGPRIAKQAINAKGLKNAYALNNPIGPRLANGSFASQYGPLSQAQSNARSYLHQLDPNGTGVGIGKTGAYAASQGIKLGAEAINFATKHPYMLAAGIGGIYGGNAIGNEVDKQMYGSVLEDNPYGRLSNIEMNTAAGQEDRAAGLLSQSQVAPMGQMSSARRMLMNSTQGLVQGLHQNRHRG